jgi:hypothetical protein
MPTREEVRVALDGNFKKLMDCLGQLTEEELTSRPAKGTWTAKDIIAHVWVWGDEAVQTVKAWRKPRPWQEGVAYDDNWNESRVAGKRVLPLITVVDGVTGAHRRLMHQLDLADDAALDQTGRTPWGSERTLLEFVEDMAVHYADHARDLAEFQDCCLNSDGEVDANPGQ